VSWRVTVPCTRAQGEAIAQTEDLLPEADNSPVVVADEPDPDKPDDWVLHAYFDHAPLEAEIKMSSGDARLSGCSTSSFSQGIS